MYANSKKTIDDVGKLIFKPNFVKKQYMGFERYLRAWNKSKYPEEKSDVRWKINGEGIKGNKCNTIPEAET